MERQRQRLPFNEVQRYIEDCQYPCSKQELITCARDHKAPTDVIQTLESLGSDTEIRDVNSVKRNFESFQM